MKTSYPLVALGVFLLAMQGTTSESAAATAVRGMVATVHPLATDAGVAALDRGGNAVDAAVAAALVLGVVDGHNSGIGGGCFILIRRADGRLVAIDGRETAPQKATPDMYLEDGRPRPDLSTVGPLASGTPGALAAYDMAVERCGQLALSDLLLPAADLAERGFSVSRGLAGALERKAPELKRFEGSRTVLLKTDGTPYTEGETLKLPDLAQTYRSIALGGTAWFYRGPFAEKVGQWMAENGGILSAADFARYRAIERDPVISTYRGYKIVGFPPPSSGGVHVAQILNILEPFDLRSMKDDAPVRFHHVVAEAMKLAFADRAFWLGDADFTPVPVGLTLKRYGAELARQIETDRVAPVLTHGRPPGWASDHFGKHTTHIGAADAEGHWVAITATVNTSFGSKVIVPTTGVVLNNEMDDFSIAPGVANTFGLIGAQANAIAPRKRPLSSMSPTIVLDGDRPILTLGAAGGPKIITAVVQTIVNHLDLDMPLARAVAAPRIHHQWMPEELRVETSLDPSITTALEDLGHQLNRSKSGGVLQAIGVSPDGDGFVGVHDPRVAGKAAGPSQTK